MTKELEIWKPSKFEGTDLLPLQSASLPAHNKKELVGRENIDASDLILPTLALLQGQSEAVTQGVEGAQPGKFYLSTTEEIFSSPLRVLLVHHSVSKALFPKVDDPRFDGLERCVSKDGVTGSYYGDCEECGKCTHWDGHKPPLGAASHNFVAMTPSGPAVLRMARTSFQAAKKFLSSWMTSFDNLFDHPTILRARQAEKQMQGKKSIYYRMELKWIQSENVPPNVVAQAKALYEQISEAHEAGRFGGEPDEDQYTE